jgi:aminopeptidase N
MKTKLCILSILLFFNIGYSFSYELCNRSNNYVSPNSVLFDSTININYYGLNLTLTTSPNFIYGITNIKGNFINPNNLLFLNLTNSMLVDSVTGTGVTGFSHSNNFLNVSFDNNRNNFDIKVYYKGLPGNSGFGSFVFSTQNSNPVIWSLSEPFGSSDWFPNKNSPSDKADSSEVWITCASNLTGVSNGLLYETITNQDNTVTYKWKSRYPIASYLISIAVTNYFLYTNYFRYAQSDSMAINHYIYPGTLNSVKSSLDLTPKMLELFSEKYSLYPFVQEKYGHAQFGWGGGMEHQTIASMGSFGSLIIAHELAHQWFGDKVTCRNFNNIWLNEGFATYSESVWLENNEGRESYNTSIKSRMSGARNAVGSLYVLNTENVGEIFNSNRTYSKGAVVLHMLRGVVGDSTFFNVLKSYVNDPALAYSTAITEDLQRVSEQVSGKNLNYFFQEWVYGENYPVYNIGWNKSRRPDGMYDVSVNVTQKQNTNPQYFSMPVDIKIFTSNNGDTTFTVFNNAQTQVFNFVVNGTPSLLTYDPNNKILKDKKGDDPVESIDFRLLQNYPNPFNPQTKIMYMIKEYSDVNLRVYDLLGREVAKLVSDKQRPGTYEIAFTASNIASGIYVYKLDAGGLSESRKMVYIK